MPALWHGNVSSSTNAKEFQKREFFYVQDTWRANPKLTLNLGARWELYFPESVNAPGNGAEMNLADAICTSLDLAAFLPTWAGSRTRRSSSRPVSARPTS